jgi:hypothetical protein
MTTTTLRPNADVTSSGATLTGAASNWQALSDGSDTSYVDLSTGAVVVAMDDMTLPAGAVVISGTVRVRAAYTSTSGFVQAQSTNSAGNRGVAVTASAVTYSYADGGPLSTNALINALQMIARDYTGAGVLPVRVYELYYDVLYATKPTSTATGPTGTITTTSSPTVTWSYSQGSDGGPQARYQVRVFSAAQYGIAGFDPGSSPSTYDSAEQYSGATSAVVGPLPGGIAYRAYMRAAQTVLSLPQYSDWTFVSFTINPVTSDVSTVSATADNTNGRNRVTITRNTGTPAWTSYDLQRSSDGGTTFQAVRGGTGALPPGDVGIIYDYEAGNGSSVLYQARANYLLSGLLITGAWVSSSSVTWTSTDLWLKDLTYTPRSLIVNNVLMPEPVYDRPQGVFRIIGSAFPVVVSDVLQAGVSTITLETYSDAERDALKLLCSATVLLLQAPAVMGWGNRYVAPGALHEVRKTQELASSWLQWDLTLTEIAAPADSGTVVVAGLTWQDIVNTYATWTEFIAGVPTWGTLV